MNLSAETDLRSRIASRTNNLQFRIGAPFILLVTLVFAIFLVVATVVVDRVYIDRLSAQLESQAEIVALAVTDARARGDDHDEIVEFLEQSAALADNRMTLIGADGQVLADTGAEESGMDNHGTRPEILEARERGVGQAKRDSETLDEPFLYVAVAVPDIEGSVLRLAVPVTDVDQAIDAMQRIVLAAILVVLALTLLAAWFTGRRLARPLSELQETANAVAAGDFTARAEPSDVSEIAVVGQAFNSMAERLHAVIEADRHTNARLEAIMAGLVDGVVLTDGEGNILRMNEAASRMLDADIETAIGRPFVQVSRDHEIWIVLRDALRGKKKPSATVEHGIERMSLLVTARALQEDGELLGLMVLRDVSELRRLELVRREFVSNVSHELRTPLTSIRALVETLEAGALDEPDLAQDFLSRIIGEVDRLNALVEDLLDFARLEAGRVPLNLQPVDIGEAIRIGADRLRPQIERARLDLHIDIAPDLPEIEVDTKRIEQVMINLVHNAIKFTPPDGAITVRVYQRKGNIVTEVQDTGVGIPHDEQARLFERFYKSDKARRSEGTGLGLAIAKNIVLLHGGKIEVESEPGEGAIFRFMLPIARKKAMKRARKHALGLR